jgi:hypothetical protein
VVHVHTSARTHANGIFNGIFNGFQRLFVGVEIEARARVQAVAERAAQVARLREQESALSSRLQEVWGEVEAARRGALSRCVAGRSG